MGEVITVPKNILVHTPMTDKVNKDHIRFYWDAVAPYAVIYYQLEDDDGKKIEDRFVKIEGAAFTTFVTGFALDLKNRAEAAVWADIQANFTVQDK